MCITSHQQHCTAQQQYCCSAHDQYMCTVHACMYCMHCMMHDMSSQCKLMSQTLNQYPHTHTQISSHTSVQLQYCCCTTAVLHQYCKNVLYASLLACFACTSWPWCLMHHAPCHCCCRFLTPNATAAVLLLFLIAGHASMHATSAPTCRGGGRLQHSSCHIDSKVRVSCCTVEWGREGGWQLPTRAVHNQYIVSTVYCTGWRLPARACRHSRGAAVHCT